MFEDYEGFEDYEDVTFEMEGVADAVSFLGEELAESVREAKKADRKAARKPGEEELSDEAADAAGDLQSCIMSHEKEMGEVGVEVEAFLARAGRFKDVPKELSTSFKSAVQGWEREKRKLERALASADGLAVAIEERASRLYE